MTAVGLTFYAMTAGGLVLCLLWASRRAEPPRGRDLAALFALLTVGGCMGVVSPVTLLGGTGAATVVTFFRRERVVPGGRCLRQGLGLLALLAGADLVGFAVLRYRPFVEWVAAAREQYPPVSRDSLLPQPAPQTVGQTEPHPGRPAFAEAFSTRHLPAYRGDRDDVWELDRLHATHTDFATRFALRPEFGPLRMMHLDRGARPFDLDRPVVPTLPQPRGGWMNHDDALADADAAETAAALEDWHARRGVDFANADGFGLLGEIGGQGWGITAGLPDDLDPAGAPYLVGFEPHRSRTPPGDPLAPAWELVRVELIGLVTGPAPVAYASDELPRMGKTATHRERSLTAFERAALPRLAAGECVVAAADADRLLAVGALPAAAACAACHGVEEGRLLGALSYDFRRTDDAE